LKEDVLYEIRERGIAWITLNRPDSLNSMGDDLLPLLAERLAQAEREPQVRVVVITGAGRGFCSGGDMSSRRGSDASVRPGSSAGQQPALPPNFEHRVQEIQEQQLAITYRLRFMGKPTIAMVNGAAAGAGFSLALACDLRIASDRARFTTAFRNVGLSGDFGGSYFLTRLAGDAVARQLYFTGRVIDAAEALRAGLLNQMVPHDTLEQETLDLARLISDGPVGAYARIKRQLNLSAHADLRTVLESEAVNITLSGLTADAREAGSAFLARRKPEFA